MNTHEIICTVPVILDLETAIRNSGSGDSFPAVPSRFCVISLFRASPDPGRLMEILGYGDCPACYVPEARSPEQEDLEIRSLRESIRDTSMELGGKLRRLEEKYGLRAAERALSVQQERLSRQPVVRFSVNVAHHPADGLSVVSETVTPTHPVVSEVAGFLRRKVDECYDGAFFVADPSDWELAVAPAGSSGPGAFPVPPADPTRN